MVVMAVMAVTAVTSVMSVMAGGLSRLCGTDKLQRSGLRNEGATGAFTQMVFPVITTLTSCQKPADRRGQWAVLGRVCGPAGLCLDCADTPTQGLVTQ